MVQKRAFSFIIMTGKEIKYYTLRFKKCQGSKRSAILSYFCRCGIGGECLLSVYW